jgi:carbon monoxide dehydrogenase subunit G
MSEISFTVEHRFDQPTEVVWAELVDWERHAEWIPMTTMDVEPGDPTEAGREFTARTGVGPLVLVDQMRVTTCDWDASTSSGTCEVDKLGPVLVGVARFTVTPDGPGSMLEWVEDVTMKRLPKFLAPVAGKIGAIGFKQGMRGLAKNLAARPGAATPR